MWTAMAQRDAAFLPNDSTISAKGSDLRRASLATTFDVVNAPGSSFPVTSFQSSGVETVARGIGPQDVGRDGVVAAGVLQHVDVDPVAPLRLADLHRRPLGHRLPPPARRAPAPRPAPRRSRRPGPTGVRTCRPVFPEVFTNDSTPRSSSAALTAFATATTSANGRLARVEVEQDEVGAVEVLDARGPDVERQRPLVDEVEQRRLVVDQGVVDRLAALGLQFDAGDPVGVGGGRVLLPEVGRALGQAVGQPFERDRAGPSGTAGGGRRPSGSRRRRPPW